MNSKILAIVSLSFLVLSFNFLNTVSANHPHRNIIAQKPNVEVEILTQGYPKTVYYDGPYRWIEGYPGERFSFRITNRNSFPVGVIPSADGQSLTANGSAKSDHPAYVIAPYNSLTISVWREDLNGGRELMFTGVDSSLAARKGDRRNIGVLGVLVWQLEDIYRPPVPPRILERGKHSDEDSIGGYGRSSKSQSAPSAGGMLGDKSRTADDSPGIGVGTGNRVYDSASVTDQYRRVQVLGTIPIYYDDRPGLIRAGVNVNQYVPSYPDRRGTDPFPGNPYKGVEIPRE